MRIQERIDALRRKMNEQKVDAYLIPSSDNHQSEYVGNYFKAREFITGFTGSAGTALVTKDKAMLWTDGRYFIQAETELSGAEIQLMKIGEPGVPSILEYLSKTMPQNSTLAFDGRVISALDGMKYKETLSANNIHIKYDCDFIDEIWENRPPLSDAPLFLLTPSQCGESATSKLERLRQTMTAYQTDIHILTSLDDIAWLLNIRGKDTSYTPVVLSYAVITMNEVHLFIDSKKLSSEISEELQKYNVHIHLYNGIYQYVSNVAPQSRVLLDTAHCNYALYRSLPANVTCITKPNPTILFKAIKNHTEIKNTRIAHLKDAIAHTKFMYWVKTNWQKLTITELSASEKLEQLRAEQDGFLWPSFEPISAFGANAAMCHYSSSEDTNVALTDGGLFLTDTGGYYKEGSTDITRTIAIGNISKELKVQFTNVLRGNLALARIHFLYGCTGENLDILARQFLWNQGLDYKHGTGHGVGHLLSIHEGPCSIKWQYRQAPFPLEEGMILSDEPGVYIEGSHGIRLENELLVCKGEANEYGQFMHFEVLTFVPFDLDAIDIAMLNPEEKVQLNEYHKQVFEKLSPYLNKEEKEWLKYYTRPI